MDAEEVKAIIRHCSRTDVMHYVWNYVWYDMRNNTNDAFWLGVREDIRDDIENNVGTSVWDNIESNVREKVLLQVLAYTT